MKFATVLPFMLRGRHLRRKLWPKGKFLGIDAHENGERILYHVNVLDILASDWEVVDLSSEEKGEIIFLFGRSGNTKTDWKEMSYEEKKMWRSFYDVLGDKIDLDSSVEKDFDKTEFYSAVK